MSSTFTSARTPADQPPWESESDFNEYEAASSVLQTFDQPHFPGVNKAEGGPFYGDYQGPETVTTKPDWEAIYREKGFTP